MIDCVTSNFKFFSQTVPTCTVACQMLWLLFDLSWMLKRLQLFQHNLHIMHAIAVRKTSTVWQASASQIVNAYDHGFQVYVVLTVDLFVGEMHS